MQKITTLDRQLEIALEESGVYLVRIQTRQGAAVRKLVIGR